MSRRTRSKFFTESIDCNPQIAKIASARSEETEFEKKRGVSHVEIRSGFAQVHVNGLKEPLAEPRLEMLEAVRRADISIDFLKFTASGVSFLVPEGLADQVRSALEGVAPQYSVETNCSIVLVHAVNMRDEEGLLARIVSVAIASGARLGHLGDMHDRLMIATTAEGAVKIKQAIDEQIREVEA